MEKKLDYFNFWYILTSMIFYEIEIIIFHKLLIISFKYIEIWWTSSFIKPKTMLRHPPTRPENLLVIAVAAILHLNTKRSSAEPIRRKDFVDTVISAGLLTAAKSWLWKRQTPTKERNATAFGIMAAAVTAKDANLDMNKEVGKTQLAY